MGGLSHCEIIRDTHNTHTLHTNKVFEFCQHKRVLLHCIRDVIGHPPYGHGAREIGGSHE